MHDTCRVHVRLGFPHAAVDQRRGSRSSRSHSCSRRATAAHCIWAGVAVARVGTKEGRFDPTIVLPYPRVKRRSGATPSDRLSRFTARSVLAGLELDKPRPGHAFHPAAERCAPATSDLAQAFLVRRGVEPERIVNLLNVNGTLDNVGQLKRAFMATTSRSPSTACWSELISDVPTSNVRLLVPWAESHGW